MKVEGGSQTLARGLRAVMLIGEAETPPTVAELAAELGIHRSMAYRLVATLEQFGFVERTSAGRLELGLRIAGLARTVAGDLQSVAGPHLQSIADELQFTAFIVVYDGEAAVTLQNALPRESIATVAQRPGSRHEIDRGAPGRVIRSQLHPDEYPPQSFEYSEDEVIPGLSSYAVPLAVPSSRPAALAVIFPPQPVDEVHIVRTLHTTAQRITDELR